MVQGAALVVSRARARTWSLARQLGAVPVWHVLATFIVLQWILVIGIARTVRHNGWIYYQGGDQLWYYTLGWLIGHGSFTEPLVGYLWSIMLAPIAFVAGPNLVSGLPAIVVLNVVVLLPVAIVALYGLAQAIAGRVFAYWVLVLWVVAPLFGIWYTETGYHQRFTEILLPQGLGLTAMADFPTMVAVLIAACFCARLVFDQLPRRADALAAGAATGAAIALKPSAALFLAGPPLAVVMARRWRAAGAFALTLSPALITLAVWKYRGYGYVPLLHSLTGDPTPTAAGSAPVALHVPHYITFDWHHFTTQLDLLREHFWSGRLIEWFVVGGSIAVALLSRRAFVLVAGWFFAFVLVKAGGGGLNTTSIEDTNLLRILIPAYPAFLLLVASIPFLVPGLAARVAATTDRGTVRRPSTRNLTIAALATVGLTAIVPLAVIAAVSPVQATSPQAVAVQQPPLPTNVDLGVVARRLNGRVRLRWRSQDPAGGRVFYHVFRVPKGQPPFTCPPSSPAPLCILQAADLGTTRAPTFLDRSAGKSRWTYRVGVAANWLNDPAYGDVYELSEPVTR